MAQFTGEVMPVPSEHQAIDSKVVGAGAPTNYTPSEKEKKALKLVRKLFKKAKEEKAYYDKDFLKYYQFFRGKQWPEARPSYRHSDVINLVFRTIQSDVPILADTRPKIEFLPQEPSDLPLAKILNQVIASDWEKYNWLNTLTECLYDAHIFGTTIAEMSFDPELENGLGAITFKSMDPFEAYPDPEAEDIKEHRNCKYFQRAEPMSIERIKKKWPKKGKYVKGDVIDWVDRKEKTNIDQIRFRSPTDNRTIVEGQRTLDTERNKSLVITTYIMDRTSFKNEEVISVNEAGEEVTEFVQKLKYPRGRKIVIAGGIVLEDGENEFDDGKYPYARMQNYMLPREFWGVSEVEQLESPQKIFNKLVSFSLDVLTLMGNPVWIVDKSSGIDTDNLINRPGLIIEKQPGTEVRREAGTSLQPYILQLIDRMKLWFDDISGSNDVSRGAQPTGITAAAAIEALQEASNTRLRQKGRFIDAFLQDLGQLYVSRVFQYYKAPRIVRLTNNQGAQQFFSFNIEDRETEDGSQKVAVVSDILLNKDLSTRYGDTKEFALSAQFDIKVNTGSSLPFQKATKKQELLNLFDRGIIDEEEVLNGLDYPNKDAVLQRLQERMQAQAMAAQAQAGQGAK